MTSLYHGGAETLLYNLIEKIDRTRFTPVVCCLKERGTLGEILSKRVPVYEHLLSSKYDIRVLWRLSRLFKKIKTDGVVTVGAGDKMFWGRLAAKIARVPVVVSALHSTGWPDGVGRLNRALTNITDGFIAVAKEHGKFLNEFEKFPKEKIFVIPNGVECDRFQPLDNNDSLKDYRPKFRKQWNIPEEALVCGIVARLHPVKNHTLFLEIAKKVSRQIDSAHFVIVGEGEERAYLQRKIFELGLEGKVHLVGLSTEIEKLWPAFDLGVLTSDNEANPVSLMEAMACGISVVSTKVGSVAEVIKEGQHGLLFEKGDAENGALCWLSLLENAEKRKAMGVAARRHIEKNWSLLAMVKGYETMLEEIYQKKEEALLLAGR